MTKSWPKEKAMLLAFKKYQGLNAGVHRFAELSKIYDAVLEAMVEAKKKRDC